MHFPFTNLTTCLASTAIWFNSEYHRRSFLGALPEFLRRMPDYQPLDAVDRIMARSSIMPQGIDQFPPRIERQPGPLRILWAARWEHDKNPDDFFRAVKRLMESGQQFRLSVIGEQFREVPEVFARARDLFEDRIDHWGYLESRTEYVNALLQADVVVSTAHHEFFGISVVEAIAAGAYPLLPDRLAYPEVLDPVSHPERSRHFYDGSVPQLVTKLNELAERSNNGNLWGGEQSNLVDSMSRFYWDSLAVRLDDQFEKLISGVS